VSGAPRRLLRAVGRRGPTSRVTVLEGYRLGRRLMLAAREFGAEDPREFLEFLRQQRRGYSATHDGPSELMRLVDAIDDYERREAERRSRAG